MEFLRAVTGSKTTCETSEYAGVAGLSPRFRIDIPRSPDWLALLSKCVRVATAPRRGSSHRDSAQRICPAAHRGLGDSRAPTERAEWFVPAGRERCASASPKRVLS